MEVITIIITIIIKEELRWEVAEKVKWSQRALRSSLFFSNRVSQRVMLAGFLALGGFAGPVKR